MSVFGQKLHCSMYAGMSGPGFYRILAPSITMSSMVKNKYRFCNSESSNHDDYYLRYCDSFRVQRLYTSNYKEWYEYLLGKSKEYGFSIIYDVDDILFYDDIPVYNWLKPGFFHAEALIHYYMAHADKITTTNMFLANYYASKLDIPIDRFTVVPNYLPKWWYGAFYDVNKSVDNYKRNKKRPRIVICCDKSHVDYDFRNNGIDDFTHISDWIIENRHKYQFVLVGCIPYFAKRFIKDFEVYPGTHILGYPSYRKSLDANLYIQPLQHSLFNYAKSNIKQLEAWADGIPILTQDTPNYTAFDERNVFSDDHDLDKLVSTYFNNLSLYKETIIDNYKKLDSFWLENNIDKWETVLNGK